MANRIPHHFLEAPRELVNVSFTDFASGKGIVDFFLGNTSASNVLTPTSFYSDRICILGSSGTSSTYEKLLDADFDAKFLKQVTIEGDALVTTSLGMKHDEAAEYFNYVVVRVRKWDGSTETEIADTTGTVNQYTTGAAGAKQLFLNTTPLTIPKTSYKIGESLRVTIEVWCKQANNKDSEPALMCDPKGRLVNDIADIQQYSLGGDIDYATSDPNGVTISNAQIPFRV